MLDLVPAPPPRLRTASILLVAGLVAAACASTPGPVGPASMGAALPAPEVGAGVGARPLPDAPDGPVLLREPRLRWTHVAGTDASYSWGVGLENPSSRALEVTLVVQVLDADGRALDDHSESLLLGGGERLRLEGSGSIEAPDLPRVGSWRIDYWVRVPAPPDRRTGGRLDERAAAGVTP